MPHVVITPYPERYYLTSSYHMSSSHLIQRDIISRHHHALAAASILRKRHSLLSAFPLFETMIYICKWRTKWRFFTPRSQYRRRSSWSSCCRARPCTSQSCACRWGRSRRAAPARWACRTRSLLSNTHKQANQPSVSSATYAATFAQDRQDKPSQAKTRQVSCRVATPHLPLS